MEQNINATNPSSTLIIADAGGTSTDWALICNHEVCFLKTEGLNPASMTIDVLRERIGVANGLMQEKGFDGSARLQFYGAGCRGKAASQMETLLREGLSAFRLTAISVESDMVGAARAACGCGDGIVCILGTGSNSCLWRQGRIERQISAGGFILGDEGSGASLGKHLLADFIKGLLPAELEMLLRQKHPHLGYDEIVENVYRSKTPQRYLASFAYLLIENRHSKVVREFVEREFNLFFNRVVAAYGDATTDVALVGGVAYAFEEELRAMGTKKGFSVGKVLKSPLEELVAQALR